MPSYLEETYFCNYSHPSIQTLARYLSEKAGDRTALAKTTFYHVRDRIITGYDLYQTRASEILEKGHAICWGKSVLLIALLRCNGVKARFATIPVHRKFIKPLIGRFYHLANSPYNHCVVQAHINDRWTVLDPVLDRTTYKALFLPRQVPWDIDWNGKDDCRLYTEHVVGELTVHPDIDGTIREKAGNAELPGFMASPVNHLLNKGIWKKTGALDKKSLETGACP